MTCYGVDTIFFALNATYGTLDNTTGKCNGTATCGEAYCSLATGTDADWICFSGGGMPQPPTLAPTFYQSSNAIYVLFGLLLVYALVVSVLFGRLYYRHVHLPYQRLASVSSGATSFEAEKGTAGAHSLDSDDEDTAKTM